ncbi:four helix bundle protein [bacterium]|nr:four helix bundle protein [bacterium]
MKKNVIQDKSFEFSLEIIELYKLLIRGKEYIISKQLLRSGTSIGANIEEASAGQSKRDFTAKMSIASKEARETRYWLKLLQRSQLVKIDCTKYLNFIEEIINVLTAIVKTSQNSLNKSNK